MEEDTEYLKLPVEDRCVHKLWKARVSGYEEAAKLFNSWDGDELDKWKKYYGHIKKFVTDSNAVAQEKGLVAALAFVENCDTAGKTTSEVVEGIVNKCVAAPKTNTKDLANQVILMYCEIETHEKVIEELLKGFSQKNPKVVSGCVGNIHSCLRAFGAKVIKVSPLLKAILPLLDHRDKTVREQCKILIIEAYRWVGAIMKSQLTSLKPVQLTELEAEFEKLEDVGRARPQRYLKSQQATVAVAAAAENGTEPAEGVEDVPDVAAQAMDPYELIDPVDILPQIPKNFYELVEEKKWQLRKEALDALFPLSQTPKIVPGDFGDLIRVLKKFISKDTNVMLVALAAQCVAGLAKGLRSSFKQGANILLSVCLEKFKEKKANVVAALVSAVDAMYPILGIENIQEDCLAALKHKTPSVNSETAKFLARCFSRCPPQLISNKKMLKGYVSCLLEKLGVSDPGVREASSEALGVLVKFVGEPQMMKLMPDLDPIKLAKVKDYAEKAELTGKAAAGGGSAKPAASKVVKPTSAPKARIVKPTDSESGQRPSTVPKSKMNAGAKKGVKKGTKGGAGGGSSSSSTTSIATEPDINSEEVQERAKEFFSESIINGISDGNWKTRLASMEELTNRLNTLDPIPCLIAIKIITIKPGLKDNNFQVLGQKVNAIRIIAEKGPCFTQQCWDSIMPELIEKFSDPKNCAAIKETFYVIAEKTSFSFVFNSIIDHGLSSKSPKVKSESLTWAADGIVAFGLSGIQPKVALDAIKKGINESNPAVRTNAIHLIGILHWFIGPSVRRVFEDEKAALLTQIDTEIAKHAGVSVPSPTRGGKKPSNDVNDNEEVNNDNNDDDQQQQQQQPQQQQMDLVPRSDISGKITDSLLEKMGDKNWKVRKEAMDELKEILHSAKFITANVGNLPTALSTRFGDSNKIISVQSVEIAKDLIMAMGPHVRIHVPQLLPGLLSSLSDSKSNVRVVIIGAMDVLLEQVTLKDFFINEMFPSALAKGNPFVKQEIFAWLSLKLPEAKNLPKEELALCIPMLYACVEDRCPEVRKAAQDAIPAIMRHLGFNKMRASADKLKPSNKNVIMPLLDKARETIPQPPPPTAPPPRSAPPGSRGGGGGGGSRGDQPSTASSSSEKPKPERKASSAKSRLGMVAAAAAAAGSRKKAEDIDNSPPYIASNLKNVRFKEETKLKVLKWNFSSPRQEFVDQLKDQMTAASFNKTLMTQMFHNDFKQHLKVIDTLSRHLDADLEALIANLDLILKWMTLRFCEAGPSVLLKGLEYLNAVFSVLADDSYVLHDIEAMSFIPYLINKVGDPKDQVKLSIKNIIKTITQIYPASKLVNYLMNGLASKNAKQRTECLDELGCLIRGYGTTVLQPSASVCLKEIAKQISDRDNTVRNAALNTIAEAYFQDGERMYKLVGNLPEKDMAMLEERIKRASKNRPPPLQQQAPPPPQQQQQQQQQQRRVPNENGNLPEHQQQRRPPPPPHRNQQQHHFDEEHRQLQQQQHQKSSPISHRPISGIFQINYEEIEGGAEDRMSESGPRLVSYNLDEIYEPVKLPETISRAFSPPGSGGGGGGGQGAGGDLTENDAAYDALGVVLAQVFSPDAKTSLSALVQLDELMKDNEKAQLLAKRLDQLFVACYTKYRHVLFTMLPTDNCNQKDVIHLFQYITMVLMSTYHHRDLTKNASMASLYDLMHIIISILIEPRIQEFSGGGHIIRALNILTVKIVERSDHTNVTCAFLKLLRTSVADSGLRPRFVELVMKCLWKVTRELKNWIDEMNVDVLMAELHEFLKTYPSSYWKTQSPDTPMRTVKTMIHDLAKIKGSDILNHLTKISDPKSSELVPYLHKLLNSGVGAPPSSSSSNNNQPGATTRSSPVSSKLPRFSKSDHEALAEIFKKIGNKDQTKQGLEELYNFKQQNPHADFEPFLAKSSPYFREYIERGLKSIESEVRRGGTSAAAAALSTASKLPMATTSSAASATTRYGTSTTSSVLSSADNTGPQTTAIFLERLRKLRAAGGLDNDDLGQENIATTTTATTASDLTRREDRVSHLRIFAARKEENSNSNNTVHHQHHHHSTTSTTTTMTSATTSAPHIDSGQMDDLRKRLERLKNVA